VSILTSGISGNWRTILVSKTLSGFLRQLIHRILLPFSAIRMVGFTPWNEEKHEEGGKEMPSGHRTSG